MSNQLTPVPKGTLGLHNSSDVFVNMGMDAASNLYKERTADTRRGMNTPLNTYCVSRQTSTVEQDCPQCNTPFEEPLPSSMNGFDPIA